MKKIFLGLFVLIAVLSFTVVLVKAENETSVALTDGVQIRTDGNNGLRWEATVTNPEEGQVYGFVFAQGEYAPNELTVSTAGVVVQEVNELDEDNKYRSTMINFPKKAATQDITVRSYVKVAEEYIYSENVVTRNLSEVAIKEYEKGTQGDFVKAVYDASETTFNLNGGELVADYEYKVTRYNTGSGTGLYIGMSPSSSPSGATGLYWYRICFKYVEELGLYKIVATRTSGASLGTVDYDYIMGAFESSATCTDKAAHKIFREIIALGENAQNYYAQFDVPTTSTCDVTVRLFKDYELFNNKEHYGGGVDLPEAKKEYYDFAGWYSNADLSGTKITEQGKDRNLYAKYTPTNYSINYNLNGGNSLTTLIEKYNIESETIILPTALEMAIDGGKFGGWYNNSALSGEPLTEISTGNHGNIELYASWIMDKATNLDVSANDINVLETINPTIIVNPLVKSGKYLANGVEYASGSTAFATIADALSVAKQNDVIYVFAGTYDEALTISTANLTIVGPNYNVHGNETRNEEANITALTTINAANVTINGLKFTSAGNIKVGANNVTITNIYMKPSTTVACNGQNRQGCIVDSANISDLTVSNSFIDVPGSSNTYTQQFMSFNNVKNLTIINNYITNSSATTIDGTGSYAGMRIYTLGGTFNFSNNELRWATNGYAFYLANVSAATTIDINDNIFTGNGKLNHTATLLFRSSSSKTTINIIGNEFDYFKGSTFDARYASGSTINVKYNYFDANTSYKISYSANYVYLNNYYAAAQSTSTSDYGVITSKAALDAAYESYLSSLK